MKAIHRLKSPAQSKGKTSKRTHTDARAEYRENRRTHTDIDNHPCTQTYIHPDIHGKSVSLAPTRLGSNLRSRSRELATCALGAGRKC